MAARPGRPRPAANSTCRGDVFFAHTALPPTELVYQACCWNYFFLRTRPVMAGMGLNFDCDDVHRFERRKFCSLPHPPPRLTTTTTTATGRNGISPSSFPVPAKTPPRRKSQDPPSAKLVQTLRKALNVHPEKYQHTALSPASVYYSRSCSPQQPKRSDASLVVYQRSRAHSDDFGIRREEKERSEPATLNPGNIFDSMPSNASAPPTAPITPIFIFEDDENDNADSVRIDLSEIITINVAGMRFQTRENTLNRFPETILGNPFKRKRYYNAKTNEYFFDRHRTCFESILHIYQTNGEVLRPESIPIDIYLAELRFFHFSEEILEKFWINEGYQKPPEAKMPTHWFQRSVWELLEYPDSSLAARIFAFLSIFVIVTSIVSFCLETIPELRTDEEEGKMGLFLFIEYICSIWFSIELLLRFASCPDKMEFCKSFLNILDFVAVAPFFINFFADKTAANMSFSVLRIIRLVRVFRIFKLSRHSVGLQVLGKTFKASIREFCLLIFFLVIALVLFSSGVYFAEQGEPNTKFTSIPASFWFVLATLSTVGYGDLVPTGVYGKIVGGCCALIGVITLALPVPIIVANFKHFYRQEIRLAKMYTVAQQDTASNASRKSFDVSHA